MMNIEALLAYVREHFPNRYGEKVPMAQYTSFHIGGPADLLVAPESVDELQGLLKEAKKYAVPTFILGNGSNLLVRDGGIRGLVIKLGNHLNGLSACGVTMEAGAGVSLAQAARFAAESGLSGLEFAVGIPGSLGGAVIMNAGAYDGDMGHVVKSVTALNGTGEIVRLTQKDLDFSYRHSALQDQDLVVLSVSFVLKPEEQQIIEAKMADFSRRRRTKQPLDYPSAGSTFKRPFGHYAAALIDEAGLKGMRVGDAMVSPKHAGFVINCGKATARDTLLLMRSIEDKVFAKSGVRLEPEVMIIGEDV
ncbi:UDP-N-acetylmuramate dehydrogenase [Acidaminococcus sp. BV3L6]|uniref:UDP-N-acetylmuramate dehydrogenase n=1 Tax=Acidaminococcus TaxID=904 RepID=UPI0003AE6243|nr:UDP-N-acetylmuramate dehydrogenase [Acidaminococcus sp. BV3L6]ERL20048.1 UDP-N-acetylmuramate dehydrogenase [Acidaminococcus sp. BV3L6]